MQEMRRTIGPSSKEHGVLGLGCWSFGGKDWPGQEDEASRAVMEAALQAGMNHWDTAGVYGDGRSEELIGEFLHGGRRDEVFLATKTFAESEDPEAVVRQVDDSLARLQTEKIDLYYLHWPRSDIDMRPVFDGLERARSRGKIGAIGVSNFSVQQMEQVAGSARIDAHQLSYSLLWRSAEREIIPYCRENGIAVVGYSTLAMGILTGKFDREPQFAEGEVRPRTIFFDADVWPHIHAAVERMKQVAADAGRPLAHLALQWATRRSGITTVLVGARNPAQVEANAASLEGAVDQSVLDALTAISDDTMRHVPDAGNIFRYYP